MFHRLFFAILSMILSPITLQNQSQLSQHESSSNQSACLKTALVVGKRPLHHHHHVSVDEECEEECFSRHWIFRRKVEFEGSEHGSIGEENVAEFLIEKEELMRRLEQIRADRVLRHRGMERNQFRLGTGVSPAVYAATHSEFGSGVRRARVAPLWERQQDWLFEQVAAFAGLAAGALRREEKDIPHLSGGDVVQSLPLRREWIILVHGVLLFST
jgi:hypothetical protein